MRDEDKSKEQLIDELVEMRMRIADLEDLRTRERPELPDGPGTAQAGKNGAEPSSSEDDSEGIIPECTHTLKDLLESPLKWQITFNSVCDAICLLDLENRVLDCNAAMLKLSGKPAAEVIGEACWKLLHHATSEPVEGCPVARMRKSLSKESMELSIGDRWLDAYAYPIFDEKGCLIGALHILSDITTRKRAEEALKRSEEKYRELVENANSIILRMDKHGNVTFFNEFAEHFFGYREDEIIGKNVVGTIVPEVDSMGRHLKSMIDDLGMNPDRYINNVNENMRRNGDKAWIAWTNKPILDDGGRVLEVLCIGNDITERKRAEDELQKLASVVRYSSEIINLATVDGKMIFLNDAGAMALGIDPDEIERTGILQVIPDDLQEKAQTEILPTLMQQGSWEGDLQYRNLKTGKLIDVHAMTFTISDPATGVPLYLANVSADITEWKRVQESLRQSEEKFSKAFRANPAPMAISSLPKGAYIDVNESFLRITGYERHEVIGHTGRELGFWDQGLADDFMNTLMTVESVRDWEIEAPVKSGDLRTLRLSAEVIRLDGKPCMLTVADDITERKRTELALQESQRQLSDIIDFLPDATMVIDRQRRVIAWNRAMEEMTGINKADILGRDKDAFGVHDNGQPRPMLVDVVLDPHLGFQGVYDHLEQRGNTLCAEAYVPGRHSRRERQIWATASPLYDRDGKVIGAIESVRDITERKEMESTLRAREKELEAKSHDLEEINTALRVLLKRREEDQKEFGMDVLSNLKELVFPYIERLKGSGLDEMQRTYMNILESHLGEIGAPFLRKLASEVTNLSPMERQIATLIKAGKQNKEISRILGVSLNTISTHRYHLRTKLGLKKKGINLVSYLSSIGTL